MKKYHIAIDATRLSKTMTGIDYYTYHLLKTFYENRETYCSDFHFTVFVAGETLDLIYPFSQGTHGFSIIKVPFQHPLIRQQIGLLYSLSRNKDNFDIFHSMGYPYPLAGISAKKKMLTVYDVAFRVYPEMFTRVSCLHWNWLFPKSLHRTNGIIVISATTGSELVKYYPFVKDYSCHIAYCGISPSYLGFNGSNQDVKMNIFKKYNLPPRYILSVATLQPRKNIPFIIDVMKEIWGKYPMYNDIHLVLAGNKGWMFDDILKKISNSSCESKIHFTGYIPENDLAYLYSGARVFVYPSLYEGFGIPPVEAMACGTPVITSDKSSLPEIVGDSGYCLPLKEKVWMEKIIELIENKELADNLSKKGRNRAKMFTWEISAQKVINTYKILLSS